MTKEKKQLLLKLAHEAISEGMQGKEYRIAFDMKEKGVKIIKLKPSKYIKLIYKDLIKKYDRL